MQQRIGSRKSAYWKRSAGGEGLCMACAAYTIFQIFVSGLKRDAKKGADENAEMHPSGAKAHSCFANFSARLKSCPKKKQDFSHVASQTT